MSATTTLVTVEDFLNFPDPPSGHLELHNGESVLVPPPQREHITVQQTLLDLLLPITKGKGFRKDELPFQPAPEYEFWVADFGFISADRWGAQTGSYFRGAPDLTIEVKSPSNTWDELNEKQRICLNHGCRMFWIVDPKYREIHVTDSARTTHVYTEEMNISLTGILEAAICVRDVFADL